MPGNMNKNLTEIAFILDRSGSMAPFTEAAITGFNEVLRDQQKAEGQARLTLVCASLGKIVAEEDAEGRKEKFRSVPRCEAGGKLPT